MIHLPKDLGLKLCEWHSSASDPIYQVGSSAIAGKPVTRELLEKALTNLEYCWKDTEMNPGRYDTETVDSLADLIDEIELGLMRHPLRLMLDEMVYRNVQAELFLHSLAPEKLSQAQIALANVSKAETNENLLFTLAANVPLESSEWMRANELYGMFR
jgi:hypothetical protein